MKYQKANLKFQYGIHISNLNCLLYKLQIESVNLN